MEDKKSADCPNLQWSKHGKHPSGRFVAWSPVKYRIFYIPHVLSFSSTQHTGWSLQLTRREHKSAGVFVTLPRRSKMSDMASFPSSSKLMKRTKSELVRLGRTSRSKSLHDMRNLSSTPLRSPSLLPVGRCIHT